MERKLQNTNVMDRCVTLCLFISLTHFAMQVTSLSYQAASCNIIVGLNTGQVELLQTDPQIAPSAAPQVILPVHECVRQRLAEAQAEVKDIEAALTMANGDIHLREQELKESIANLEVKCACPILYHVAIY